MAGALPQRPRLSLGDGGSEPVTSPAGQAEPHPGTHGTARAHVDRPGGQTLADPGNPG
jgi:hypothetical protein